LAGAKRHGISELTIYKGCKRSSGFRRSTSSHQHAEMFDRIIGELI